MMGKMSYVCLVSLFGVFVDEEHDKLPTNTLYWLHKLLKSPYVPLSHV